MTPIRLVLFSLTVWLAVLPSAYPYSVAMPTQWATEAAIEILEAGGNATDAMVAGSFALNVSQPYNMGIGGGGFYLVTHKGKTRYWDSRELAPASAHERMFLDESGKPIEYYPDRVSGPNPVGVPGTVAGLYEAHKRLGRLPWKRLLQPAIRLAREGFPVTRMFAENLAEEWERVSRFSSSVAVFGDKATGGPIRAGHLLRQPALGNTLETIAKKGAAEFYKGALAKSWLAEASKLGVRITEADLAGYKVKERRPIQFRVFGLKGLTAPPPSAAGLTVAGPLRFLEHYYRSHDVPAPDSPARVIVTTEALRYFQELRNAHIADPPHATLDPQKFLGSKEEKEAWKEIEKRITEKRDRIETAITKAAEPFSGVHARLIAQASQSGIGRVAAGPAREAVARPSPEGHSHTAHLSVIDDNGMAVAYTTTIEQWFGSGITVPGHGFLLNNELSDFTAEPGKANSPAPGKRPRSNMSPTLLFEGNKVVGSVGCAGGSRIPTVIVELLENYYVHKMSLRAAIAFPRFHPDGDKLNVDKRMRPATLEKLKEAGYTIDHPDYFGTAQAIVRRSAKRGDPQNSWESAADPSGDGLGLTLGRK